MKQSQFIAVPSILVPIVGSVLSVLIVANGYFVKRLVDQMDATREIVWHLRQDVVVLKVTVDNFSARHIDSFKNNGG
jgi:hypothetical protein